MNAVWTGTGREGQLSPGLAFSPRPPPSSGADFDGVEHLIKGVQE